MKIVTTVGTSLITNQLKDNEVKKLYEVLKQKDFSEKKMFELEYKNLKEVLTKKIFLNEKASAEIKSIIKLKDSFADKSFEVELIATDSLLSPICAELLKSLLEKSNIKVNFNKNNIIEDLQVSDYAKYKKGLINLLNRLNQIGNNGVYFDNLILNITGGFKGIIPYLTIFSQVNNIPLYYIFEFTGTLIKVPQIPIKIDEVVFDKYWKEFYNLNKNDTLDKSDLSFDFLRENDNLLEIEESFVSFNALGKILWNKYETTHFIFYADDNIFNEIEKQNDIKRILSSKFKANVLSKTETKGEHLVYDDGNNSNRIFYFEKNNEYFIYKTFQNHDLYEKYINSNTIDKESFIKSAKRRKFSI